jgi:formylglycine-generating enzyme required for sulfatase activity
MVLFWPVLSSYGLFVAGCPEPTADEMVELTLDDGAAFSIDRYEYPNRQGQRPRAGVTLAEAAALCEDGGKRLCTAAEWRRACAGAEGRRFPYGTYFIPNICRVEVDLPGGHTSLTNAGEETDRVGEGGVSAAGSYWDCATPEGVHDLSGNVEEWVLDGAATGGGGLEGGAWYTRAAWANCTGQYSRQPDYRLDPTQPVASAGFRCCMGGSPDAEADAQARLAEAKARSSTAAYAPEDEVEVAPGRFMDRYEYPNRAGEHAVSGVTWAEAAAACGVAGKRLCGASEWEAACGGSTRTARPYGEDYVPAACGIDLPEPGRAGSWFACESDAGVRDLVGGVWEWTASTVAAPSLAAPGSGTPLEVRGGSWFSDAEQGVCRPTQGYPVVGELESVPDLGFRCCRGAGVAPSAPPIWDKPASCPEGTVRANTVCIDVFEHPNTVGRPPTGGVDWDGARAMCRARGKRVCTDAEWTAACEGPAGRRWPTGDVFPAADCHVNGGGAQGAEVEPREADAASKCRTPEGAIDMAGNVWEWAQAADGTGVIRGGGWDLSAGLAQCRVRTPAPEGLSVREVGVRCCSSL